MNFEAQQTTRYGAYAIIIENAKLLLSQKKSGPYKGLWDLPGGGIEFGETPEYTLKREIQEETAFAAHALELITVMTNFGDYFNDGKKMQIHHVGIIYRVNGLTPLPHLTPEEKQRWIAMQDIIPHELTPFAKQAWSKQFFW